jgi:secondary thiamine-phosphate synthase enzyme
MDELTISTTQREELIDLTAQVADRVLRSGLVDGLVHLWCNHTTAGLTINENADPDVKTDLLLALREIVPEGLPYRHGEGNSPSHVKSSLVGCQLSVPVVSGRLALGTWQGILFCEFDGPRPSRRVRLTMIPSIS